MTWESWFFPVAFCILNHVRQGGISPRKDSLCGLLLTKYVHLGYLERPDKNKMIKSESDKILSICGFNSPEGMTGIK